MLWGYRLVRIIHRLSFNATKDGSQIEILDQLQLKYNFVPLLGSEGLVSLEISEDHQHWFRVKELSNTWDCVDFVRSEFSIAELRAADYLVMRSTWLNGYPMPDEDNGYLDATYGGSGCESCGNGMLQCRPFQLRSEPKWGRRALMQLNWIPDEFFVTPEAFSNLFADFGLHAREVLHYKHQAPLKTVVQLDITAESKNPLQIVALENWCNKCGRTRCSHQPRGFFPSFKEKESQAAVFRTQERFGDGGVTWSEVIVSQQVYRALSDQRIRAVAFRPLASNL